MAFKTLSPTNQKLIRQTQKHAAAMAALLLDGVKYQ
jgi:hypothetical protein